MFAVLVKVFVSSMYYRKIVSSTIYIFENDCTWLMKAQKDRNMLRVYYICVFVIYFLKTITNVVLKVRLPKNLLISVHSSIRCNHIARYFEERISEHKTSKHETRLDTLDYGLHQIQSMYINTDELNQYSIVLTKQNFEPSVL